MKLRDKSIFYQVLVILIPIILALYQNFIVVEVDPARQVINQLFIVAILLVALVYFISSYFKRQSAQIDENTKDILKLRDLLKFREDIHKLDKRLSMVENKSKKAQTEITTIVLIVFIILIFLYLRSVGLIPIP